MEPILRVKVNGRGERNGRCCGDSIPDHLAHRGGFGLANISAFTRKISFILFGLFFLGFLLLLGFALLVTQALSGVSLGTDVLVVAALALE